jgi:dTMP kinase
MAHESLCVFPYSPQWAPHVKGMYEERWIDPETQIPDPQRWWVSCDICHAKHQGSCQSGGVKTWINRFASVHPHRDVLTSAEAPKQKEPDMGTQRGRFVVIEGPNGVGKTEITRMILPVFRQYQTLITAEPTKDEPYGMQIRRFLEGLDPDPPSRTALAVLYAQDRLQHARGVIMPAVESGRLVICDRYVLSSLAYQHGAMGLDLEWVRGLSAEAPKPDMTIVLMAPEEECARRRELRAGVSDAFEKPEIARRAREVYERAAEFLPGEMVRMVNAEGPLITVFQRVCGLLTGVSVD